MLSETKSCKYRYIGATVQWHDGTTAQWHSNKIVKNKEVFHKWQHLN
jgi:hypothetical protein